MTEAAELLACDRVDRRAAFLAEVGAAARLLTAVIFFMAMLGDIMNYMLLSCI
jgi:hypothetical protein